jgi:hypothetical protein
MPTIFDSLEADNLTWSIHFTDWCDAAFIYPLDTKVKHFIFDYTFDKFLKKAAKGNLDTFTYLIPRSYDLPEKNLYANS